MKETSLTELAESFETKEWNDFDLKFNFLIKNNDIAQNHKLSFEQIRIFTKYIEINNLFHDCLKPAAVSKEYRQELEDNLFFTAKPEN